MIRTGVSLFVLGALLGTLGDSFHVFSLTDGYLNPLMPLPGTGQPLWVPFLFGSATVSIGLGHVWADKLFKVNRKSPFTFGFVVAGVASFLALYAASGFMPLATGGAKDWALAGGAVGIWAVFDRSRIGILNGIVTAASGTAFEMMLSSSGAFFYYPDVANFFGVPSWLPWIYVAASVAVGNAGRFFMKRDLKTS